MYKPGNVENIELMIYFSPENLKGEIFNNLKRCENETTLFYLNKYFWQMFFFPTRASNSADVDGDYVVDGDDNVGDTDGDE